MTMKQQVYTALKLATLFPAFILGVIFLSSPIANIGYLFGCVAFLVAWWKISQRAMEDDRTYRERLYALDDLDVEPNDGENH